MIPDIAQFSTLESNVECNVTTRSEKGTAISSQETPIISKEIQVSSQEIQVNSPDSSQILEPSVSKAIPGKLDKHQHCFFYKSKVLKIARHLTTLHKDELEVAQLLAYKESKSTYNQYKSDDADDTLYTEYYPQKEAEQSLLPHEALDSDEDSAGPLAKRRRRSPLDCSDDENEMVESPKSGVRSMEPMTKGMKLKWSNQEIATLKMKYGHLLSEGVYPSGQALSTLIKQNSCFKSRTTAQIRSKLQYIMRK